MPPYAKGYYKAGVPFRDAESAIPYLGPADVRAFIGAVWLDDVVHVSFQVQDDKRPLFGFKSRRYDVIAPGQTLVQGTIVCHFRFPGYLTRVIDRILTPAERDAAHKSGKTTSASIDITERNIPTDDIKKLIEEAALNYSTWGAGVIASTKKTLSERLLAPPPGDTLARRPGTAQAEDGKLFDLRLLYGRTDSRHVVSFGQTIHGVALTGQSQEVSAMDGNGDTCLYEAYSFIGREVTGT